MAIIDFINQLPVGFWTVMSVLASGALLKITEKFLNRDVMRKDQRTELRTELDKMRVRLDKLEEEADDWRKRYYLNEEEIAILRAFIRGIGHEPPERQGSSPLYDEKKYKGQKYVLVPTDKTEEPAPKTP